MEGQTNTIFSYRIFFGSKKSILLFYFLDPEDGTDKDVSKFR